MLPPRLWAAVVMAAMAAAVSPIAEAASPLDLSAAVVVAPGVEGPEAAAIDMLVDEVRKRTGIALSQVPVAPDTPARIVITHAVGKPEGYRLTTRQQGQRIVLTIAGNDSRGVLFGIGHLLRTLSMTPGHIVLDQPLNLSTSPNQPVRGHQIGYRYKNNTYDAWTLPQFEQQIRDLAVFGANAVQLIAPASDDAPSSPLFPAPALETTLGIARLLDKYGLDCDLFYPEMRQDYADPATVAAELAAFEDLVRRFPHLHAVYVPGGDPGHTPPDLLFPLLERQARILRRYHPGAQLWVSGQGFDEAHYEAFYRLLARRPAWLTGVFFGPQSRDPLPVQRGRIPRRYPIQFYPDIGHTLHAQFPVPHWDSAFALLEGREPINPRPRDETLIFRHFASLTAGFVTYSEGVNDDVNKVLWTRLGWNAATPPEETLRDYAHYSLGGAEGDQLAALILALERNWSGPIKDNSGIAATLQGFQGLKERSGLKDNWRFESLLYRATYDAYAQARARAEARREAKALDALAQAPARDSRDAMAAATAALAQPDDAETGRLRDQLFDLAGRLYAHVGLQLSVPRYGASGVERGANLDRVDTSLNDRVWLTRRFADIAELPDEMTRQARLAEIVTWRHPVPGSLYDDLGNPEQEPHLVRGKAYGQDPELYDSAIDGIADRTPDDGWRLSWITYAETLYERPIHLRYQRLDPKRHYTLRVTYAGEDYALPMRLTANGGIEIHAALPRPANPATLDFDIPQQATRNGRLDLEWTRPPGLGGSGRGHQVAEAWLIPRP
ncbi:hypothetical protein [Nitrospirillum amazonense]|uniref:Glycosyl hydrolase family 20 n=1 Tax=Nitrospirillum amazonense TaxID=28077 RepID=A0A560JQJ1_9PROT|nr:hypothetical protein [Nitrospirillum amazonense]MDG3442798.1 hypothetical protein [Nitrospirillum amazonense]TWB71794.1 hypothetical protein FBZ87_10638 [Nitrospirillum amazonense]